MDVLLYALSALIGGLFVYLMLANTGLEATMMKALDLGKRVIIAYDNDALIFRKEDNSVKITRATLNLEFTNVDDTDVDTSVDS